MAPACKHGQFASGKATMEYAIVAVFAVVGIVAVNSIAPA